MNSSTSPTEGAPTYILERRFHIGGTDFAQRLATAIAKHPEITEVVETKVEAMGKEHGHATDLRIVYRAERELDWVRYPYPGSFAPA